MSVPTSTTAPALAEIRSLSAEPICSTAFRLHWEFDGAVPVGFEVQRQQTFDTDQSWRRVATLPPSARQYESVGLMNAPGRSWRHRVRAIGSAGEPGAWSELPAMELPQSPGGPRGELIVPPTPEAPRNIHASFIKRRDGELFAAYTASTNNSDYSRSWIPAIALTPAGKWEDRGILFPSREDWPIVSRPSFVEMPDGRIAATYSIGKRKPGGDNDWRTTDFIHRTVFRTSSDEGRTWSPERIISDDLYDYELANSNGTRNIVLSNGRLFTSVHVCKVPPLRPLAEAVWTDYASEIMGTYLLYSDDLGQSWRRVPGERDRFFFVGAGPYGRINAAGFHETTIVEHSPGKLLMFGRTTMGYLYECRSDDFGTTWTEPTGTEIQYSICPPNLTRIPGTSTIVLLGNPLDIPRIFTHMPWELSQRQILATQLSDDGGRTWYGYRELEFDGSSDEKRVGYIYPDYLWDGDILHVMYNRHIADIFYRRISKNWLLGLE